MTYNIDLYHMPRVRPKLYTVSAWYSLYRARKSRSNTVNHSRALYTIGHHRPHLRRASFIKIVLGS